MLCISLSLCSRWTYDISRESSQALDSARSIFHLPQTQNCTILYIHVTLDYICPGACAINWKSYYNHYTGTGFVRRTILLLVQLYHTLCWIDFYLSCMRCCSRCISVWIYISYITGVHLQESVKGHSYVDFEINRRSRNSFSIT